MSSDFGCRLSVCRWAVCAAWCLLCALSGSVARSQPIFTACTNSDAHGTIYLPVRVNETIDASFFFDTGSYTYVSDAFVKKHSIPTHTVARPAGGTERFPDGTVVSIARLAIAIPGTPIQLTEDVPVLPLAIVQSMGIAADGILGVDSLRGMAVHLNMVDRSISFVPGGHLSEGMLRRLGMGAAKPSALIPADGGRYQVAVSMAGLQGVLMLVDTGSEFTRIPPALARKIGGEWKAGGVIDTASGRFQAYTTRLAKISLGDVTAVDQRVLYTDQSSILTTSPLGRDFFGRFAVTLDFPANRLYLRDLELGDGPSPYLRRLRGEETLLPAYSVGFPYGGKTFLGASPHRYRPGSSASFPGREAAGQTRVVRNMPTIGESRTPVAIPLEIENGAIVVRATIEGKPVRMALDTGSIVTWLTPAAVSRLQLKESTLDGGGSVSRGVTLNAVALSRAMPEFLSAECEGYVGETQSLYRLAAAALPKVDGVLGLDCLDGLTLGVDLANRILVLWPMASTEEERLRWVSAGAPSTTAAIALPLEHEVGDWYYVDARLEETVGPQVGRTVKLALATGYSGGLRLPATLAAGREEAGGKGEPGATRQPAAGDPARRRTIALGEVAIESLPTEVVPERGGNCIPALGLEALRDRRVVLDFAGRKLLIGRRNVPLPDGNRN